jgi:LacI family transcriptional regulator
VANIQDVAELAGVSITTVSHVINATRYVSDELEQRVRTAMVTLDYQPNRLARSLRCGETHTIGMIIPDNVNPFFAEVARGIEDAGFANGYTVVLGNSDGNLDRELLYVNELLAKQVDGIVFVAAGLSSERIAEIQKVHVPVVIIDRKLEQIPTTVDSVLLDNEFGGFQATQHLITLNHRRIACITGPSDLTPSADRITGYCKALANAGIHIDDTLITRGNFQYESGHTATLHLLDLPDPPSAIFVCNDLMAMGAISAVFTKGKRVPDDVSIVGFDDVLLAAFTNPPLTTIAQPKYEIGELAANLLLERIGGSTAEAQHLIQTPYLIVRESTAVWNKV